MLQGNSESDNSGTDPPLAWRSWLLQRKVFLHLPRAENNDIMTSNRDVTWHCDVMWHLGIIPWHHIRPALCIQGLKSENCWNHIFDLFWPLTYDLDLQTCPRYQQGHSLCQIFWAYVKRLGMRALTHGHTHRHTHTHTGPFLQPRPLTREVKKDDYLKYILSDPFLAHPNSKLHIIITLRDMVCDGVPLNHLAVTSPAVAFCGLGRWCFIFVLCSRWILWKFKFK